MSKLTAKEILSKLEELEKEGKLMLSFYASYDNYDYGQDEGFDYDIDTPEVQAELARLNQESEDNEKAWENHEGYKDVIKRDAEYERLTNLYTSTTKYYNSAKAYLNCLGLGKIIEVSQRGGSDQGSEWYTIKYFVDHDVYIKTEGYYSSYEGTEFNDGFGYEVKPVEVMTTIYNKA